MKAMKQSFILATMMICTSSMAASLSASDFGKTEDGSPIIKYTLQSKQGVTVNVINYGAIITAIDTPDKNGKLANIVLGLPTLQDYEKYNQSVHFGGIIGRYANRIAGAQFDLNGTQYKLPANDGQNTLHGGPNSYDSKVWEAKTNSSARHDAVSVEMKYFSPNGENGFPGNLSTQVTYTLTDDNELIIDYYATTDQATVVNLTNHSYFNLAGEGSGSIENQLIEVAASRYTPTDSASIPTGQLLPVDGTPLDLRKPIRFGEHLRSAYPQMMWTHGYDHNFVLDHGATPKSGFAARVTDPVSKRVLEVYTTYPGLQLYTANWLNGSLVGTSGKAYRQSDGFALEAEYFPNSPNQTNFPNTVLKPGEEYKQQTVLKFRISK